MKSSPQIRAWCPSDASRLARIGERASVETLRSRFWGGVATVPGSYLASITSRWPQDWDAVVAVRDGEIVGWAEFGRNGERAEDADVAVCVIDAEQGHGLGTALLHALLPEASGLGLTSIHADISATNTAALRTWLRATQGLHATLELVEGALRATAILEATARRAA